MWGCLNRKSVSVCVVRVCVLVLFLACMPGAWAQTATPPAGWAGVGGAGPYEIATLDNLYWLSQTTDGWDDNFVLTADIDATASSGWDEGDHDNDGGASTAVEFMGFSPIGSLATPFTGSLDGQGHVIRNLYINRPGYDAIGLFGYASSAATISNVGLESGSVSGKWNVGGLIGTGYASVTSCYATCAVTGTGSYVGGLIGDSGGPVTSCYATGDVSADLNNVGGLVGQNYETTITSCYATGDVSGTQTVGGLVGNNYSDSVITSSYASGGVTGSAYVGGLAGYNEGNANSVDLCYWDTTSDTGTGQASAVGDGTAATNTTGLSSAQMLVLSNFGNFTFDADNWAMVDGVTQPYLAWQELEGADGVYFIDSLDDLRTISENSGFWGSDFYLTADIDAADTANWNVGDHDNNGGTEDEAMGFSTIGMDGTPFTGLFDGQGYVISNLYINRSAQSYVGLFGVANGDGISNVGVEGGSVTGYWYVGGLAGENYGVITSCYTTGVVSGKGDVGGLVGYGNGGTITSCYATGAVSGGVGGDAGGLVGYGDGGTTITSSYATGVVTGEAAVGGLVGWSAASVIGCHATGPVTGSDDVGGLVGRNQGSVEMCHTTGAVTVSNGDAGGLVGFNDGGEVALCYATGAVSGSETLGGLVGDNYEATVDWCYATGAVTGGDTVGGLVGLSEDSDISSCYATGLVSGTTNVGGLVGSNEIGSVSSCYWDEDASGTDTGIGSGSGGVTGLSAAEMLLQASFLGFTFNVPQWFIEDGVSPPRLYWEVFGSTHTYAGGDGTVDNPWQIENLGQLYHLSATEADWGSHFVVTADIDASDTANWNVGDHDGDDGTTNSPHEAMGFSPIGDGTTKFTGLFDGQGHVIRNLYINRLAENFVAIFGYASSPASISNLGLEDASSKGTAYVGGLVGVNDGGSISTSYATGAVTGMGYLGGLTGYSLGSITSSYAACAVTDTGAGAGNVGGLVGICDTGSITSSYATGAVTGTGDYVGGLVGYNWSTSITSSYATGAVSGDMYFGGFIGQNHSAVTACYATGAVTGNAYFGGFIGQNHDVVTSCYATGLVTIMGGGGSVGGLVGSMEAGSATSCYWDTDTSGMDTSNGGAGLTSAEMLAMVNFTGFDFVTNPDWAIVDGETRPYLPWQTAAVLEGAATPEALWFTLDTGYVYNAAAADSGVTLVDYGIACREEGSDEIMYHSVSGAVVEPEMSVALDGVVVDGLKEDTFYFYRAYATDSNGHTHYGTEREVFTKAASTVTTWPTAAAIVYGQSLADAALSGGASTPVGSFAFDAPATTPSVADSGTAYAVKFTPDDGDYGIVFGSVPVTVNKDTPTVTSWPTAADITYGGTLADAGFTGGDASVDGGFAFDAPGTAPNAGTASFAATFTPTDAVNYATVSGSVSVTTGKATPDVTAWPTASAITEGETLADAALSGGAASVPGAFAFDAPTTAPPVGMSSHAVSFLPTDNANYAAVSGMVAVVVNAAPAEGEGESPAEGEGEAPAEGEGEAPAEGEGETPAEGEGETPAEGEGETPAEGEGETPAEGEGETPAEGEGETPAEGEGEAPAEGEGETPAEGEGEAPAEGEGETPAEGEGEAPAEGEGEAPAEGEGEAPTEGETGNVPDEIVDALRDGFAEGDTDGDGALSLEEAQELVPDVEESDFTALDTNGDGLVTESELVAASDDASAGGICGGSKKQGDWRKQLGDWMGLLVGLSALLLARRSHALTYRKK
jgi:hypothetical protein